MKRLISVAALCAAACTSGPGPVDDRPYEQQVIAWRQQKDAAFRAPDNKDSPIPAANRATFPGLVYFPIDPNYRVPAALTPETSNPPVIIELQTSTDERDKYQKVGTLSFSLAGVSYKLTAFAPEAESLDRLFVPFGDLSNGNETYKGGRFLELDRTSTGLYDLDFNRAYHPYCVFNPNYSCPVPPRENRLPVAIRAGERLAEGDKH
jgi:uncharacterized protein (DUF1684 family)